ncbi:MAG TPA: YgcG family protein [Bradyrhizobium sp.]|nr:YgcG family protein [Bradyrhizobium sp.]
MKAVRAVLLALLLSWVLPAFALVAVPQLTGRVVDKTGTLSSGDIAQLTQTLADLERRKGSQIAVLIVPTTDGEAMEQFSLRVAEAWKIGRKKVDDGALLVVAKNDRRLRIEVGYGLEGALTDVTTKRIIDEVITPKFRTGNFAGGISDGVNRMIDLVNGEKLPGPEPTNWDSKRWLAHPDALPFVLFVVFAVSSVLRAALGRLLGSAAAGTFVTALVWFLWGDFGPALAAGVFVFLITVFIDIASGKSGSSSSGWSSGSSSGSSSSSDWSSSSSSSSDSGSFSGGGGDFGGGGASGSW